MSLEMLWNDEIPVVEFEIYFKCHYKCYGMMKFW